jgi:Asp/Glu/hydantoin racemase
MVTKVSFLHTFPALVDVFEKLAEDYLPGAKISHACESAFFDAEFGAGRLSAPEEALLLQYAKVAEASGSDVIVTTCAFLGPTVDKLRNRVRIPWVGVDEAMAEEALRIGKRIGVLATVKSPLDATSNLLTRLASGRGEDICVDARICQGAFEQLSAGDPELHDRIIREHLLAMSEDVDVVVLSQASMARAVGSLGGGIKIPVLSSPVLCMEWLAAKFEAPHKS